MKNVYIYKLLIFLGFIVFLIIELSPKKIDFSIKILRDKNTFNSKKKLIFQLRY